MNARTYDSSGRQARAAAVTIEILTAAHAHFSTRPFDDVSLNDVAADAGVTVQTVLRRFQNKDGLFEAMAHREGERILAERASDVADGMGAALEALIAHYEHDGDFVAHLVAQEHRTPAVAEMVAGGRRAHRAWVERHAADALTGLDATEHDDAVAALIAATDLSTWRLLRLDLDLDTAAARRVIDRLVCAATPEREYDR